MRITLEMFCCPPHNCIMAQCFSQPFPKPDRKVFTPLCSVLRQIMKSWTWCLLPHPWFWCRSFAVIEEEGGSCCFVVALKWKWWHQRIDTIGWLMTLSLSPSNTLSPLNWEQCRLLINPVTIGIFLTRLASIWNYLIHVQIWKATDLYSILYNLHLLILVTFPARALAGYGCQLCHVRRKCSSVHFPGTCIYITDMILALVGKVPLRWLLFGKPCVG